MTETWLNENPFNEQAQFTAEVLIFDHNETLKALALNSNTRLALARGSRRRFLCTLQLLVRRRHWRLDLGVRAGRGLGSTAASVDIRSTGIKKWDVRLAFYTCAPGVGYFPLLVVISVTSLHVCSFCLITVATVGSVVHRCLVTSTFGVLECTWK